MQLPSRLEKAAVTGVRCALTVPILLILVFVSFGGFASQGIRGLPDRSDDVFVAGAAAQIAADGAPYLGFRGGGGGIDPCFACFPFRTPQGGSSPGGAPFCWGARSRIEGAPRGR